MLMVIRIHVATKLCWSESSLIEGIQVEQGVNVDDPNMPLQLYNECNFLFISLFGWYEQLAMNKLEY